MRNGRRGREHQPTTGYFARLADLTLRLGGLGATAVATGYFDSLLTRTLAQGVVITVVTMVPRRGPETAVDGRQRGTTPVTVIPTQLRATESTQAVATYIVFLVLARGGRVTVQAFTVQAKRSTEGDGERALGA